MFAAFVTLSLLYVTPLWLTALVIARDLAIIFGILLARVLALPIRVEPLFIGKASTAIQIVHVALALVLLTFGLHWPLVQTIAADTTAVVTAVSWLAYAGVAARVLSRRRSAA